MAKRDPEKSARNRIVKAIKEELRLLLPDVLANTHYESEAVLNANIGSKHDDFFDLKTDVIPNQEAFIQKWLQGFKAEVEAVPNGSSARMAKYLHGQSPLKKYLILFLKRSYLKRYDQLSKNRPNVADSTIWIGQKNANYGLLITPRFTDGQWENDKSEIRAFQKPYWTIGHILKTGLAIPGKNDTMRFPTVDHYLTFFKYTLVRNSGSIYELSVAERYADFVLAQPDPEAVPLLIPEYRYAGLAPHHMYRLDFLIINPYTLDKVGFELSPWSTHGYLKKTKGLTQKKINEMAQDNFENEMEKHRSYFKRYSVFCLIYTDAKLQDTNKLFDEEIAPYLSPENIQNKISFKIMEEFMGK